MKYCPDCKSEKELIFFGKEKANKDGLRSICKKCNSIRALRWHNKNIDHVNAREREAHQKNPSKNRARNKKWRDTNVDKVKEINKEKWKNRDREKNKEKANKWSENNRAKKNYKGKTDYEKNKEKRKPVRKKWEQNNKDKRCNIVAKRRAVKLQASPPWLTIEDYLKISKFYTLAKEMTERTGIKHEVDHIHPLQGENVCGLHHWNNLQVLTSEMNRAKSNNIMPEIIGMFPEDL